MITIDGSQGEGGGRILRFGGCLREHYELEQGYIHISCYEAGEDEGFGMPEGEMHKILVWPDKSDLDVLYRDPPRKYEVGHRTLERYAEAQQKVLATLLASPLVSGISCSKDEHFRMKISKEVTFSEALEKNCVEPPDADGLATLVFVEELRDWAWSEMPRIKALASARSEPRFVERRQALIPLGGGRIMVINIPGIGPAVRARGSAYCVAEESYGDDVRRLLGRVSEHHRDLITRNILS